MVGAEERPETEPFGLLGHPQQVVVGGALLGFGEDAQLHGASLPGGAALRSMAHDEDLAARIALLIGVDRRGGDSASKEPHRHSTIVDRSINEASH